MTTISRKVTRALVLPLDGTFCADNALEAALAKCENNIATLILVTLPLGLLALAILFWFMMH